ncbi:MAG: hypothetical protein J6Q95_06210 [Alistipes sp.]|nr:hypothetical protein [Alistipes sp.]
MKKFNFVYLALAFLGVIAMTSCEHPYADYTPGAKETNQGVYFPSAQNFVVSAEDSSVEILVARLNTATDAEVSVRVADVTANLEGDSLFTVDGTVKFVAEEAEAMLKVTFDGAALVPGVKYSLNIKLDPAEATNYAASEYVFTVTVPEPWVLYGATEDESVGIFFDDLLCYALEDPSALAGTGTYILYEKHAENPNRIRVVNPYGPNTVAGMWGGLPSWMTFTAPDPYYLEFDITDPEDVKIARTQENFVEFTIEFDDGSIGTFYAYMIGVNMNTYNYDLCFTWDPDAKFVLRDGIIKFPTEGIAFSAFQGGKYLGDFAAANQYGYMQYYLPGTPFVNLDMTAEYGGMKVEADNKSTSAIIKFGFAGDVESFKFTVVDGNVSDITAIVEGIVAGSEEYAIYEGTVDTFEYTVPVEGTGMKTVVAVPYSGGEAKAGYAISYAFYFPGLGGAELPEVEINVEVGSVVDITGDPAYEAQYPSDSCMAILIEADAAEITAITGFVGSDVPTDMTSEEVLAQAGRDFSSYIEKIAANGYTIAVFSGLTPGTVYDVILGFDTIYGETKYFRTQYTPGANSTPEQTGLRLNAKAPAMPAVLNLAPATLR